MKLPFKFLGVAAMVYLLNACSTVQHNATVFDYFISDDIKAQPVKTVILATVNISGAPTRSSLRESEGKVDEMVMEYLQENGIKFAPQHIFNNAWQQALLNFGDFYDPTTGKVDMRGLQLVLSSTMQQLAEHKEIDAVLFTDLLEHDVQHSGSMKHYARWYGVTREPATRGGSTTVSTDFNWAQMIKGASLIATLYSNDGGKLLFTSRGGLDTLYEIDSRKSQKSFVRKQNPLSSSGKIEEGIQLAFHPFIVMDRYPAPPKK